MYSHRHHILEETFGRASADFWHCLDWLSLPTLSSLIWTCSWNIVLLAAQINKQHTCYHSSYMSFSRYFLSKAIYCTFTEGPVRVNDNVHFFVLEWKVNVKRALILYISQLLSLLSCVDWLLGDSCRPSGVANVFVYKYYDLSDWGVPDHKYNFMQAVHIFCRFGDFFLQTFISI